MSVTVSVEGGAFRTGTAERLFKSPATRGGSWDVSADGKRFLIASAAMAGATSSSHPYHVVMNWAELLKR
jgi:hypothetical protein